MPFYGPLDLLQQSVQSILGQTDTNWTLTIVDDCYPDPAPMAWAGALGDPRISIIRNDTNLGVNGTFRRSAELSRGPWTVIVGCDDKLLPTFVARVSDLASRFPRAAVIQPGVRIIDAESRPAYPLADRVKNFYRPNGALPRVIAGKALASSLSRGNWAYFPSLVWRGGVLHEFAFDSRLGVALDLDVLLRIASRGGELVLDDQPVFLYRRHLSSVSAFTAMDGSRFAEERHVLELAASRFDSLGWNHAARIARHYWSSRANALTVLPRAIRSAGRPELKALFRHILRLPRNTEHPDQRTRD